MSKHNMLRCTYIVLIHNDEDNILSLVNSLKKTDGNFRKEYIFVDDGSKDESLSLLKIAVNDLPRTTIITQSNQGPAISINKAVNLTTGDYIHFVEGNEILHPESTAVLLHACVEAGAQVAFGQVSSQPFTEEEIIVSGKIIEKPIESILLQKSPDICLIGKSGTFVHKDLLVKVGLADSSVYSQNMSLSLRCAKSSKFVYVPANISYKTIVKPLEDSKFVAYNNLKSIYNFAKSNEEFFSRLVPELLKYLSFEMVNSSDKMNYAIKSFTSKYFKTSNLHAVFKAYKKELDKLF
jgi:glycosyltransferase involved in cell wall biosynthesis